MHEPGVCMAGTEGGIHFTEKAAFAHMWKCVCGESSRFTLLVTTNELETEVCVCFSVWP